jgi:hypothetical protein
MDAPVSIHAPKLIPWLIIEGLLIAAGAVAELALHETTRQLPVLPCPARGVMAHFVSVTALQEGRLRGEFTGSQAS